MLSLLSPLDWSSLSRREIRSVCLSITSLSTLRSDQLKYSGQGVKWYPQCWQGSPEEYRQFLSEANKLIVPPVSPLGLCFNILHQATARLLATLNSSTCSSDFPVLTADRPAVQSFSLPRVVDIIKVRTKSWLCEVVRDTEDGTSPGPPTQQTILEKIFRVVL